MLGPDMTLPPPLAIGDVRYVGDTVALVVAESRAVAEDACELVEVEYEPGSGRCRLRHRRRRHRAPRARRVGARVQRDGRHAVHADLRRPRRGVRGRRPCRGVHDRAEPLHRRADGDAGDHRLVDAGTRRDGDRVRHAVGARDAQLLRALSRHPGREHHRHRTRCRRRVRPEDVRVPRGVRDRPRGAHARPAGEVDRGPAREPAVGPAFAQRTGQGADGRRRRRHHPGDHAWSTRPTSARTPRVPRR